jgi:uncharacterized membrane protein
VLAVIILCYAALSFYSDSKPDARNLATALSLAPIVLIGLALAWRWCRRLVAASICVLSAGLLYYSWGFFRLHYEWSNLLQQVGAYALVALGFVRSLSPGQVPLCVKFAGELHGPLSPDEIAYGRRATVSWAAFYALLALAITVIFFIAPAHVWSLFVNFGTFGLIGVMFAVEHALRRRSLPHSRRGNTVVALRQFLIG